SRLPPLRPKRGIAMAQTRRRWPVVTLAVVLAAVVLAFRDWYAFDGGSLRVSYPAFAEEPWRLVSPVLLHAGVLPLILSLYWLLAFGAPIELRWGRLPMLAVVLLFAAATTAAEFALFDEVVGLGGVSFGLFGLIWVL